VRSSPRRHAAISPDCPVEIHVRPFETWEGEAGAFDLVYAATAWHWVDPSVRYRKTHDLLRAGGHLAFWSALHAFPEGFDPFFTEIQEVYDTIGESYGGDWPPAPPEQAPDFADEIERSGLFEDVRVRRYVWERHYSADEYIALAGDVLRSHLDGSRQARAPLPRDSREARHTPSATPLVRDPPRRA
jgi:SAM-dependent methyltransferase